tara:strand:+ start:136 stop:522 length:387 start_codon:yes stop_codon:yes gene_type:complete
MIQKALRFKNKSLLMKIFFTELFFGVYIFLFGFKKFTEILISTISKESKYQENEILRCEKIASRFNGIKKCLIRNGTIYYYFKKYNISCVLVIGVSNDNEFASHCWVESSNNVIDFDEEKNFKEIYRI